MMTSPSRPLVARHLELARHCAHVQGDLWDTLSDWADAEQQVEIGHRGGHCIAMGALQARLDACNANLAEVQAEATALKEIAVIVGACAVCLSGPCPVDLATKLAAWQRSGS